MFITSNTMVSGSGTGAAVPVGTESDEQRRKSPSFPVRKTHFGDQFHVGTDMSSEVITYLLIGLCGTPFVFIVGFVLAKEHIQYLARKGGEERYPERLQRVVRKYRREHYPDR